MKILKFIFFVFLITLLNSCSKQTEKQSSFNEKSLDLQMIEAYKEGLKSLKEGDVLYAAKKFNEAEILYPQSIWAPRSALMAAYSYYIQNYYSDAVAELERFTKVYSKHKNLDYAYFLLATSYYEQIVDEKKDLQSVIKAKENYMIVVEKFPNTDYAIDASFKLDLINDILASKEMYIGRYYLQKKKWISAINRFRNVVDLYQTTIYVEEALHRLVETYYIIGLKQESEKYAKLLGYNYQSSEWYEMTYSLFDKKYVKIKQSRQSRNKVNSRLIKKIKSLFE
ncbi:outer membrane protein assembly factor BamD [Candidatus Pelagibacter sp.]|nr:outer membrane protein assembly factor BamD [Candidatus Pelagibacter sp.]